MMERTIGVIIMVAGVAACGGAPVAGTAQSPTPAVVTPGGASPIPELAPLHSTPLPLPLISLLPLPTPSLNARTGRLPGSLEGVEWARLPTSKHVVALTFDAGSGDQGAPAILDALAREHVAGTFFLTGRWVEHYPDMVRRINAVESHSIGNHSMSHPQMPGLDEEHARAEITGAESLIRGLTNRDPRPLFRFPYGASSKNLVALANSLGYGSIRWTVDTQGWKGRSGGQSSDLVEQRVLDTLQPGEIVLMHMGAADDGSTLDADALPKVIRDLKARGYGFVAVWDFIYRSG